MLDILAVYGTRPEAIKMAPVVEALRRRPDRCRLTVCVTAQHRELLDQVHELFSIEPDIDLDLMRPKQALNELAARAFTALDGVLAERRPDWVLVQGDTTTALVAAIASFHRRVRVGHVEAGLRTGDLSRPFPEELNRRAIDLVADACFTPTERAHRTLAAEGVPVDRLHLTGNTVVDALEALRPRIQGGPSPGGEVLITLHRRESFGEPVRGVFRAIQRLADEMPEVRWIYPVHPNPQVREPAHEMLGGLSAVELCEPLDYLDLLATMNRCRLVLTDSGGLQEEAPALSKPVLVLRETTERPEGVEAGVARLVGLDPDRIADAVRELLTDPAAYAKMATGANPYGDGQAAERIAAILLDESWEPFRASAR